MSKQGDQLWEYPLSSWAYDIKLRQLILIHQLGIELEVIHKEELSSAYWYVSNPGYRNLANTKRILQWLCSIRNGHLQRITLFVKARADRLNHPTRAELVAINTTLLTLQYHTDHTIATAALAESLAVVSTLPFSVY